MASKPAAVSAADDISPESLRPTIEVLFPGAGWRGRLAEAFLAPSRRNRLR